MGHKIITQNNTEIKYDKILVSKERKEQVISEWIKAKGFDLSICTLRCVSLKLNVNLVFGEFEEFKKFIWETYKKEIEYKSANAFFLQFDKPECTWNFLLITENDWTAEDYGTICHELHHFTHFGLTEKGISYGEAGEECFAYVQGYFMELVVRAFVELRKAKDKKIINKKKKK